MMAAAEVPDPYHKAVGDGPSDAQAPGDGDQDGDGSEQARVDGDAN
jgi:hypothetical protein